LGEGRFSGDRVSDIVSTCPRGSWCLEVEDWESLMVLSGRFMMAWTYWSATGVRAVRVSRSEEDDAVFISDSAEAALWTRWRGMIVMGRLEIWAKINETKFRYGSKSLEEITEVNSAAAPFTTERSVDPSGANHVNAMQFASFDALMDERIIPGFSRRPRNMAA
jgi:hypothetical protein